jgi:predicted ATPase
MSIPSLSGNPQPLVGRERELGMLRHHLDAIHAGNGSVVLIGGEAGIGKTALAEAVCREAVAASALVLVGSCFDLTETPPYGPWIELFGQYSPTDALPLPNAFAQRGTVGEVTSQAALFHQVLDFFRAVAAERPVLLLLDDLHWADLASFDLLRFLSHALSPHRVLLVVTYRADELTRRHPLYTLLPILVREASATRIDLRPLHQEDIAALVRARYRLSEADATQLVVYLTDRSEGNPFFLGELLRTLEEEDVLQQTDADWSLGVLAGGQVPPLLRQVIDGRVARLGVVTQQSLAVAAVIGQEVPFDSWMAVTGHDEATLLEVIEQAMAAHLLDTTADGLTVRFVHALIREALYAGIVPIRRRIMHRQIAETLATRHNADADTVAFQFQQAGDSRAVTWLIAAGERAQHAHALSTAATRYEAALAVLEASDTALDQRGWLLYRLALLRRHIDLAQCIAYLDAAMRIAETVGDGVLAATTLFVSAFLRANNGETTVVRHELAAAVDALESLSPSDHARLNAEDGLPPTANHKTWRGSLVFHLALAGHFTEAVAMGEKFIAQTAAPTARGARRGYADGGRGRGWG